MENKWFDNWYKEEQQKWTEKEVKAAETADTEHIEGARKKMFQAIAEKYRMSPRDLAMLQVNTPEDDDEDHKWKIAGTVNGVEIAFDQGYDVFSHELTLDGKAVKDPNSAEEVGMHLVRAVEAREQILNVTISDTMDAINASMDKKKHPENIAKLVNKVIGTPMSDEDYKGLQVERTKRDDYMHNDVYGWKVKGLINGVQVEVEGYFTDDGIGRAGPTKLDDVALPVGDRDEVFYFVTDAIKKRDGVDSEGDEVRILRDRVLGRGK